MLYPKLNATVVSHSKQTKKSHPCVSQPALQPRQLFILARERRTQLFALSSARVKPRGHFL
jgi:hypothetical protein